MRILLTNDDGISADGLVCLEKELRSLGEIFIVVPERQQSGVSHSLTLYRPLMVRRAVHPYAMAWAVDGTPADCVKDRKSTRLNSSHSQISYAVFCLKKKKEKNHTASIGK